MAKGAAVAAPFEVISAWEIRPYCLASARCALLRTRIRRRDAAGAVIAGRTVRCRFAGRSRALKRIAGAAAGGAGTLVGRDSAVAIGGVGWSSAENVNQSADHKRQDQRRKNAGHRLTAASAASSAIHCCSPLAPRGMNV